MKNNIWRLPVSVIGIGLLIISGIIVIIKNQSNIKTISSSYFIKGPEFKDPYSQLACILTLDTEGEVAIEIPLKMIVNDSYHFTSTLSYQDPAWFRSIHTDFSLYLRGAAFNIEPASGFRIKAETIFPIERTWSVAPKIAGEHELVLDFSEYSRLVTMIQKLIEVKSKDDPIVKLAHKNGTIVIPISVRSILGLKPNTITLLQYLFSFIGFILMWPGLMWVFEKLKRKK